MAEVRGLKLILAAASTILFYVVICVILSIPIVMGECLPRSDPRIAMCDVEKRRDFFVYLGVFLANFGVVICLWRKQSADRALLYLAASSILPLAVVIAMNLAESALGVGWR